MQNILAFLAYSASLTSASPFVRNRRQAATSSQLLTDITQIQQYWGQVTPYHENNETFFGVEDVGVPNGCQIEQAHLLERHGARFPTSGFDDGANDLTFGYKVTNFTANHTSAMFTGPLAFLNTWQQQLDDSGLLFPEGAVQSFDAGTRFWAQYGRDLYNATPAQVSYNDSFANGTMRPKLTLRATSQSRIWNTGINWALGFFGPSFQATPNPTLMGAMADFHWVVIPEGGTENNTLASYDSCANDNLDPEVFLGDYDLLTYYSKYLKNATARMQKYAPTGFIFTTNDTYAMQSICAYETNYLYSSDFCTLFTEAEWQGFEATLDMEYYYDYSFGNPTGRAQGIGYVEELLARLQNEYITTSDSSVNSTYDSSPTNFTLGQKIYADFSHDDIIISVLTALSMDYFHQPFSTTQYPPDPMRHFILSNLTPFAARLITEVIGCTTASPTAVTAHRTPYYSGQYNYTASAATHKFIRMRLNNGILPVSTLRGGACAGRSDGMCSMDNFMKTQENATALANYQYACFGNYTIGRAPTDYDGTYNATAAGSS